MEKGELVDRVIKLTQQLAAEQDKNKILAEQKAELLEALKEAVRILRIEGWLDREPQIKLIVKAIKQANK